MKYSDTVLSALGCFLVNRCGDQIPIPQGDKKNFCIFFTNCWYLPEEFPPPKPTDPIKQRSNEVSRNYLRYSDSWLNVFAIKKFFIKISGHQQRWPRPLPGAILIPPAPLVVADFSGSSGLSISKPKKMNGIHKLI